MIFGWNLIAWAAGALAFVAVIVGGVWWIYNTGRDAGAATVTARYEAELAKAQAEAKQELERRQHDYDALVEKVNVAALEFAKRNHEAQERIEAYERIVEDNPDCRLSDDDIRELDGLRRQDN